MFDHFLGIDWSGARGPRLKGLQVAACESGLSAAPSLVVGPQKNGFWRRSDVLELIADRAASGDRTLVGIDFAFAYAHHDYGAYFPGYAETPVTAEALWRYVDGFGRADDDFYGGHIYAPGSPVRDHYMAPNWKGAQYTLRQRRTEHACARQATSPHPVFKCIGAANVGTGSLAGMRLLAALKTRLGEAACVWPFDGLDAGQARVTVCEIFPRLYFKHVGADPRRWVDPETIGTALAGYGADAYWGVPLDTEDKADAVVSAAALRALSTDPAIWRAPGAEPASAYEGWIFGVE